MLARAFHIALQKRNIGTGGIHFVAFVIGLRALQIRFGDVQRGFLLVQRGQKIVLIQFADNLAFVYHIAHIHRQLLNNAAGFAFDLHLGDGLDFAGCDDGARQIDPFSFG